MQTTKISTSGIAIVNMLCSYSSQSRMIGSFSTTAGLLVALDELLPVSVD